MRILIIAASLMLVACDRHMEKVPQDKTPPETVVSPGPHPASRPVATIPDGSQTNTGNQVNAPRQ